MPIFIHMQNTGKQILIILILFWQGALHLHSQNNQVISNAGENSRIGELSISWTLGESFIQSARSADLVISQGFHQGYTIDSLIHVPNIPVFVAFPNPTSDLIYLLAEKHPTTPLLILFYDASGKLLFEEKMNSIKFEKDLSAYSAGTYLLILLNSHNEKLKTYKILKR